MRNVTVACRSCAAYVAAVPHRATSRKNLNFARTKTKAGVYIIRSKGKSRLHTAPPHKQTDKPHVLHYQTH